jgi:hypothetical protein
LRACVYAHVRVPTIPTSLRARASYTYTRASYTYTPTPQNQHRYLDPARLTAPWSQENACLLLSSLAVATTSAFFAVPISFYVIEELKLDAAATNIAQQMIALPQAFQVPIGLLTDCVPVRKRCVFWFVGGIRAIHLFIVITNVCIYI